MQVPKDKRTFLSSTFSFLKNVCVQLLIYVKFMYSDNQTGELCKGLYLDMGVNIERNDSRQTGIISTLYSLYSGNSESDLS